MKTRYKALREMQCDMLTAGFIAFFNWLLNVPEKEIRFMHVVIELE